MQLLILSANPPKVQEERVLSTALKDRIAEARTAAPHMADFIDKLVEPVKERLELAEQTSDWVMPNGLEIGADPNNDWRLNINLKAIAAGYEPTTPPSHWYCGTLTELRENRRETWPNKANEDERKAAELRRQIEAEQEAARIEFRRKQAEAELAAEANKKPKNRVPFAGTIPTPGDPLAKPAVFGASALARAMAREDFKRNENMYIDRFDFSTDIREAREMGSFLRGISGGWMRWDADGRTGPRNGVAKFVAPLPKAAFDAYKKAEGLFGDSMVRIYSPDPAHFQETRLRAIDPVIIGLVGDQYYEVFRWDIASDIAAVINKVVK